jgi:hypothetical protein
MLEMNDHPGSHNHPGATSGGHLCATRAEQSIGKENQTNNTTIGNTKATSIKHL